MSIHSSAEDRRVRKTKSSLRNALEGLVAEKEVGAITVSELCAAADINRTTFYLHYRDVPTLVLDVAETHVRDLIASFEPVDMENRDLSAPPEQLVKVFADVKAHAPLYRAVLQGEGFGLFHPRLMAVLQEAGVGRIVQVGGADGPAERGLVVYGIIGSVLGVISWWIATGLRRSARYMAERTGWLLVAGAYPLLGLTPPSLG